MNTLKKTFILVAALLIATFSFSQNTAKNKVETFRVGGACEMCKARIEKTVKVEGVTRAAWDQRTKALTVVFDPSKITLDVLQKKIAAVGHDTPKFKATIKVYNALPECCKYR